RFDSRSASVIFLVGIRRGSYYSSYACGDAGQFAGIVSDNRCFDSTKTTKLQLFKLVYHHGRPLHKVAQHVIISFGFGSINLRAECKVSRAISNDVSKTNVEEVPERR